MFDLSDYMGVWYKALIMFSSLIFGGSGVSFLVFGGEFLSYLPGSSVVAFFVAIIAYRQKQRKYKAESRLHKG